MQETQETWIRSLGWEDPLEEAMATHSSILAWEIPWTEEPGGVGWGGSEGKESTYDALDLGLVQSEQLPTPAFWPGEFHVL